MVVRLYNQEYKDSKKYVQERSIFTESRGNLVCPIFKKKTNNNK